jgi:Tol biopolymer transport system component
MRTRSNSSDRLHCNPRPTPILKRILPLPIALLLCTSTFAQTTTRVSVSAGGSQINGESGGDYFFGGWTDDGFSLSADGRYLAFCSEADGVVPGDSNGVRDIFVRDRQTGTTTRVTVGLGGAQADDSSQVCSISADGRYVAFISVATNLVAGGTYGMNIFVRDMQAGTTTLASVSSTGAHADRDCYWPRISPNGRYVAFTSAATNLVPGDTNGVYDIFVRDLQGGTTTRASVDSSGAQSNGASGMHGEDLSFSSDGRFLAFDSDASNLVPGDTNGVLDVFVHDLQTGATSRVSVDSAGVQGNNGSAWPSISADGRYVAFASSATNLVPGDTNQTDDIFLYDRQTGTTSPVTAVGGLPGFWSDLPALSPDGSHVAWMAGHAANIAGVWEKDLHTGAMVLLSQDSGGVVANDSSFGFTGTISSDGRICAFASGATNLVLGDTNGAWDVFVHDEQTGATTRESLGSFGVQGNMWSVGASLSEDGRYVTFSSGATNLVPGDVNNHPDVFVRDTSNGTMTLVSVSSSGAQANNYSDSGQVSDDGRYVSFTSQASNLVPNDTNAAGDVFVRDLQTGTTTRASLDANGAEGNGAGGGWMSADGRYVAFSGSGPYVPIDTNLYEDVFLRDMQANTTVRASVSSSGVQGDGASYGGSLSADGRYAAFESEATNLVTGDTNGFSDCFVHDFQSGATILVSLSSGGAQGNWVSNSPSLSRDGRYVVFDSIATNLVSGDTNGFRDVFVRDLQTGTTTRESVASNGAQGDGDSYWAVISRGGRYVAFLSNATNLVPGDTNGVMDVFVRDRLTGRTTRASVDSAGVQGNQISDPNTAASISADGRFVAFDSRATNLVPDDSNGWDDVFLRDRGGDALFAPFCSGDGTVGACPCGNSGSSGHGCQNSVGTGGAVLTGTGIPSLAADTVQLTSSGELSSSTSILLQGPTAISPAVYGDGLRCAGGSLKRLFMHSAVGGSLTVPQSADLSISARSAALGAPIPAGAARFYQMYYRDPSATFCPNPPGNTYNMSNAVAIQWGP